jgi:hypothetical protein
VALANKNFSIRPGASKALQFLWYTVDSVTKVKTPVDLADYDGKMQIKAEEGSTDTLIEVSVTNGRMTLTKDGEVFIFIPADVTSTYGTKKAVYDILLYSDDPVPVVTEFVSGIVTLDKGVTA